ncbi:DUF1127 domain-containing protein [Pseudomonas sp. EpS/L25]|uniref:DUF1127 domain-containing protein n=1 Tax=Pseudomonas sp. EpS/L25 TaxID=1749078 RepID=UPI000743E476|nr:DUF1127 domain-containing protein [Pseudomonas sp. EpS/L25]KUM43189.1 hypothetical protein AR540_05400 [Pseudomonas sp. EpS/L25]
MAQLASHRVSSVCLAASSGALGRLHQAFVWLQQVLEVSRQRRALYRLDDTALSDLGLSRADAWQEADKPFWQQPLDEGGRRSC